jgi:molybdopterin-synthase adenylyltransferase
METNGHHSDRYARQRLFKPIGDTGQEHMVSARVAIVGVGALGTHVASLLARAGVGYLRLIDRDVIERTNLQRQVLFDDTDAAELRPKATAAASKLRAANGEIVVETVVADLSWRNAEKLLADVDMIVDGTDNLMTRHLINDVSVKHEIPWAYGGAVSSYGSCALLIPGQTPCFACLYPDSSDAGIDTCDTVGVLAPAVAMVAAMQTTEVIKWLTGNRDALSPGMLHVDVWANQFDVVAFPPRAEACRCCRLHRFEALGPKLGAITVSLCGRQTIQVTPQDARAPSLPELAARLRAHTSVRINENLLQCKLKDCLVTVFADGRALVQGTNDADRALAIYREYVG